MEIITDFSLIKEWYITEYPTDKLGYKLKDNIRFNGLFRCLDNYHDVYGFLGVDDDTVRRRVFYRLSIIVGLEYGYIYNQWLKGYGGL